MKIVECVGNHTIIASRLICDDFKLIDINLQALESFSNTPEPQRLVMAFGLGVFLMSIPYGVVFGASMLRAALKLKY